MAKIGIDISSHNGNIDLETLKSQIDFVIIRVGYGTKGTIDSKFVRNVELCEELGIPYGFYWYSYALDTSGAQSEAEYFLGAIKPYNPTMGCWFDMEDADGYKKKNGMPSNQVLKDICYTFCIAVEQAGYYSGIYASKSWFDNQLAGEELARFDKWIAQWPTSGGKQRGLDVSPDEKSNYSLWQFTSEGRFSGYNGNLDTNYAYHEFNNPGQITPEPTPEPTPTTHFNIGDKVLINGPLYANSNAKSPSGNIEDVITYITRYKEGAAHPYNTTGDLGWMNEEDISLVSETSVPEPEPEPEPMGIIKGSRVKFTGTRSYSGIKLASWTYGYIFNVIEISGDRVVIGKGTAVTAAVNIKDCQPV